MSIFRSYRGDILEESLRGYVRFAPLEWREFAMVVEILPMEGGLRQPAVGETERRFGEEGRREVPD